MWNSRKQFLPLLLIWHSWKANFLRMCTTCVQSSNQLTCETLIVFVQSTSPDPNAFEIIRNY